MLIPLMFSAIILFGSLAVVFSFLWEVNRKKLSETEKELGRQLYELGILREVNDKIGYSLKTRDIARTIALTSERIFQLKTASYAVIEDGQIIFENFTKGKITEQYISQVKNIVLNSMYALDESTKNLPIGSENIQEVASDRNIDSQVDLNTQFDTAPKSYFNIPLVLNNRFAGIISITSPKEKAYQDEDMSMLYKIVNQAQLALGRLENVIETEKGKIQSLIFSLSSGALLFMKDSEDSLRLITINNAAKSFLRLTGPLDTAVVFSQLRINGNIAQEVNEVMNKKIMKVFRGVEIFDKHFNLYLNPVFDNATLNVIGVTLTMQDVSIEHEAEKLRENFTNMIVHELRAPLSSIKGSAELLSTTSLSDDEKTRLLAAVMSSSDRMLHDVNQLLDAAKIQSGRLQTVMEPANIMPIIEERIKMFKIPAEKRHIKLVFERNGDVPVFEFDSLRIGQIFNNLLSNAIKYNHEGGEVAVSYAVEPEKIKVSINDTGVGIPLDRQKDLFTRFYQASAEHRGKGSGLGLYISKAIIDAHGGKIWLDSEEGRGTTVTFELPLRGVEVKEEPQAVQTNPKQAYLN